MRTVVVDGVDGGEDAAVVAELEASAEIATVICGPGHIEQAHQPNEWVSLEQLARYIVRRTA